MREILGQSVITIDLESTKNLYDSGWRIICISEVNEDKISMPDMMMGSLLIPPYDTMDLWQENCGWLQSTLTELPESFPRGT